MLASQITDSVLNGVYRIARTGEVVIIRGFVKGDSAVLIKDDQGLTHTLLSGESIDPIA